MLKPLRGIDEAGAGGFFGELADAYLGYKKLEQGETLVEQGQESLDIEREQLLATVASQKAGLQQELSLKSIETFGADVLKMTDKGIEFKDDFFIPAKNPITGDPLYDVPPDLEEDVKAGLSAASTTYTDIMKGTDKSLSWSQRMSQMQVAQHRGMGEDLQKDYDKAKANVYRGLGIGPRMVQNPAYAGAKFEQTAGGMWQPIPLDIRTQERVGDIESGLITKRAEEERVSKSYDLGLDLERMEVGQSYDLEKLSVGKDYRIEELQALWEFKNEAAAVDMNFQKELGEILHGFKLIEMNKQHGFSKELASGEFAHIELMASKSFDNEKVMAALHQSYSKELQELGFKDAKELKKYDFENAWEVTKFLEEQRNKRQEFTSDDKWAFYLQARRDALEDRDSSEEWWKKQQAHIRGTKLESASKATLAALPKITMPLNLQSGENKWESSWMGYDEGDYIEGAMENFVKPASEGGLQALEDLASVDPESHLVQMFLDNVDTVLETMGAPVDPDGAFTTSKLGGIFGEVDFWNKLDWDKEKAMNLFNTLQSFKTRIDIAKGN